MIMIMNISILEIVREKVEIYTQTLERVYKHYYFMIRGIME